MPTESRLFRDDCRAACPYAAGMKRFRHSACLALALAALASGALGEGSVSGEQVFRHHCRTCHGGATADSPIGPDLGGVVGARAGTRPSGVRSRAAADSEIVWTRDSLRRFLSDPRGEMPGTLMPWGLANAADLDPLLDYLETLR
jgi:cytochrome c